MIRLLGILTGSAVAIAALIVVVGVPELVDAPAERSKRDATEPAAATQRASAPAAPTAAPPTEPVVEPQEPRVVPPEPSTASIPTPEAAEQPAPEAALPDDRMLAAETSDAEIPDDKSPPAADELRWYAFWSPFRSQIAANGFVVQLQRVTGLDYRVVNIKPGVYEVAFAYTEDAEIAANLSQISAATGLEVPE